MAYEPKPGDCSLFKNDKKGNEKAPDFKGYVMAHRDIKAGEKLELAMWSRQGTQGGYFYSGKISDPRPKKEEAPAQSGGGDVDDPIPFAPCR
jgi:uncharacterized protein (DUF736 family)